MFLALNSESSDKKFISLNQEIKLQKCINHNIKSHQKNYIVVTVNILKNAYSEPCQTSKMERFAKIVSGFQPLTVSRNAPF